jgi:hypothetical protein
MTQGPHALDSIPLGWTMVIRVFGGERSDEFYEKLYPACKPLFAVLERRFVNDAESTAAIVKTNVPGRTSELLSFKSRPEELAPWERSANTRVITEPSPGKAGEVETDFQTLVRDFGACIAIPVIYGQDYMDRYPGLLDDFWKFDNDLIPLVMIGLPTWLPLKIIRDGVAARARLLDSMEGLYRRIDQYQNGQPVDFDADMSDISETALERNRIYAKYDIPIRNRGEVDLSTLWGQNANTQPNVFWLLTYIFSTPGLVDDLRHEIAPYVKLSSTNPPRITSFDLAALYRECPLFKSCLYETFRLSTEATSIRYIPRETTISDGDHKHNIKAGTWVSAPHAMIQKDASVFPNPEKFVPDRFLTADENGRKTARYGRLKPWGSGHAICKGRTFAEKELLAICAAVISLWDIRPVADKWEVPAMLPGTGVMKPVRDIRVIFKQRLIVS